ncbi:hypothetical protein CA983_12340 [Streptomyces swartbergensis]|uniref:Uncharacterized protein n=1 Tax=Streptomyces swartbergensis TaxID=487165 RepID=A0A243S5U6_9ACTN|nr:hypothetical protein CA983_12340 [Streptomyces swartbergensis]
MPRAASCCAPSCIGVTQADLQGGEPHGVPLPIHWATFNLETHPWAEPSEGTPAAARAAGADRLRGGSSGQSRYGQ